MDAYPLLDGTAVIGSRKDEDEVRDGRSRCAEPLTYRGLSYHAAVGYALIYQGQTI